MAAARYGDIKRGRPESIPAIGGIKISDVAEKFNLQSSPYWRRAGPH
jgi:hypothetical protein